MDDPLMKYDNLIILDTIVNTTLVEIINKLKYALSSHTKSLVEEEFLSKPSIGVNFDAITSSKKFICGPQSRTEAGIEFEKFWGEHSQLKHLNGDLMEFVSFKSLRNPTLQIIDTVFSLHFAGCKYRQINGTNLKRMMKINDRKSFSTLGQYSLNKILDNIQELAQEFNEYLPLNLKSVHAVSSGLRSTQTYQPIFEMVSKKCKRLKSLDLPYTFVGDAQPSFSNSVQYVLVEVESSSKWPKSLREFLLLKKLFIIRFKEVLNHHSIASRITHTNMLDIFLSGMVLRMYFYTPIELLLACNVPLTTDLVFQEQSPPAKAWLLLYKHIPFVSSMLKAQFSNYGGYAGEACRLCKRWLTAIGIPIIKMPNFLAESNGFITEDHLKTDIMPVGSEDNFNFAPDANVVNRMQFTEIAVELIVMHAMALVDPVLGSQRHQINPNNEVTNPAIVLLRFLNLLANFNWAKRPLIVNLNSDFTEEATGQKALTEAMKRFNETERSRLPPVVIITPDDRIGSMWTENTPNKEGFQRLQLVASKHLKILRAMVLAEAPIRDFTKVFTPVTGSWSNVRLKLKPNVTKRNYLTAISLNKTQIARMKTLMKNDALFVKSSLTTNINKVIEKSMRPSLKFWSPWSTENPLDWLVYEIHRKIGHISNIYYDPHGIGPIDIEWVGIDQVFPFEEKFMDGLVDVCQAGGEGLGLVYSPEKIVDHLMNAFSTFIDSYETLNEPVVLKDVTPYLQQSLDNLQSVQIEAERMVHLKRDPFKKKYTKEMEKNKDEDKESDDSEHQTEEEVPQLIEHKETEPKTVVKKRKSRKNKSKKKLNVKKKQRPFPCSEIPETDGGETNWEPVVDEKGRVVPPEWFKCPKLSTWKKRFKKGPKKTNKPKEIGEKTPVKCDTDANAESKMEVADQPVTESVTQMDVVENANETTVNDDIKKQSSDVVVEQEIPRWMVAQYRAYKIWCRENNFNPYTRKPLRQIELSRIKKAKVMRRGKRRYLKAQRKDDDNNELCLSFKFPSRAPKVKRKKTLPKKPVESKLESGVEVKQENILQKSLQKNDNVDMDYSPTLNVKSNAQVNI